MYKTPQEIGQGNHMYIAHAGKGIRVPLKLMGGYCIEVTYNIDHFCG